MQCAFILQTFVTNIYKKRHVYVLVGKLTKISKLSLKYMFLGWIQIEGNKHTN